MTDSQRAIQQVRDAELASRHENLRVSVPLEFLWAIRERMDKIREYITRGDFPGAYRATRKVEADINALIAEASREKV